MSRNFKLHLTTRCGCMKVVDHGAQSPPREYVVVLERSRAPRPAPALDLTPAEKFMASAPATEERRFHLVNYSGTDDFGTGFYVEA